MAHTNSTENYGLPQWIGTDKPTFLGDFNSAFATIDTTMKANSDTATAASATANAADAVASSAAANATNAIGIANNAASEAATATSAAASATQIANTAKTNADSALHASAANTIENLAPAYDNTRTYSVGDLVTYIDAQNSGKLYKCIVAVNSPMEFNINYWDDVTTSEAYVHADTLGDVIYTAPLNFNASNTVTFNLSIVPIVGRWRPFLILAGNVLTSGLYRNNTLDSLINLGSKQLSTVDTTDMANVSLVFSNTMYGDGTIIFF